MQTTSFFQNEYVIWGKPKGSNEEQLLITLYNDRPITNKRIVEAMQKDLINLGCTETRIQEIDFSINAMDNFVNSLISNK